MNVFNTIETLKAALSAANITDLNGNAVSIISDPFTNFANNVPLILVESSDSGSELLTQGSGRIRDYLHHIDVTCLVSTQNIDYADYKAAAIDLGVKAVEILQGNIAYNLRLVPKSFDPGELMVNGGSLKCSGVVIRVDVQTSFE